MIPQATTTMSRIESKNSIEIADQAEALELQNLENVTRKSKFQQFVEDVKDSSLYRWEIKLSGAQLW